jgi:hypothetical protein
VFLGGTFDARFTLPGMMTLEPFEPLGEMTTFVARLAPRP